MLANALTIKMVKLNDRLILFSCFTWEKVNFHSFFIFKIYERLL